MWGRWCFPLLHVSGGQSRSTFWRRQVTSQGFESHDDEAGFNSQEADRRWEGPNVVLK